MDNRDDQGVSAGRGMSLNGDTDPTIVIRTEYVDIHLGGERGGRFPSAAADGVGAQAVNISGETKQMELKNMDGREGRRADCI